MPQIKAGAADSVVTDEHTPTARNAHQTDYLGDIRAVTPPRPHPPAGVTEAATTNGVSHSSPSGSANHSFAAATLTVTYSHPFVLPSWWVLAF